MSRKMPPGSIHESLRAPLAGHGGLALAWAGRLAWHRIARGFANEQLCPREHAVLELLDAASSRPSGGLRQTVLGERLGLKPSVLSPLLFQMELDFLVKASRWDRRSHLISLGRAGTPRLEEGRVALANAEAELFATLGERDQERLRRLALRVKPLPPLVRFTSIWW